MKRIVTYVLVDEHDTENLTEYTSLNAAKAAAATRGNHAVIKREYLDDHGEYVYNDSELVWTPDGSTTWPSHT